MRFVIFGAGAVGGVVAGRLAQHGHAVVLITRGAHGAAIRERGLRLESPVAVDVRDGDGAVVVEITGLEIHESNAGGLSLMEARFAALGGGFTVIAEPGNGTRLTGTLPLRDD